MGVTATFRSVSGEESERAGQDPSYAARLLEELPEGDEVPPTSDLSVQRRVLYIQRFSLDLWEYLVEDSPVNVFLGEDYIDLNPDHEEDGDGEGDQAMELGPGLVGELADWLRGVRFADVYDETDEYGLIEQDFEEFRTFFLAVAERGEGALFHYA
ncbi:hypothetical protein J0910_19790 [Nocardiopsis sp. CNT-189]|uniref:hypothetical protein n=1 Tax=Nocardiopsis oceanisediminis TaxID=2816862 RepID=UPI003B3265C0